MKNTDKKNSFFKKISCTHRKLNTKYKELDSVLTILGVMVVGTTVMAVCNTGSTTKAETKVSLTNNKAEEYYFSGDYAKAITEYTKMEKEQEWPYYEAKLAEVYSASGDIKKSNELLEEVVRKRMTLIGKDGNEIYQNGDAELGCLVAYLSYINENEKGIEYAESFYKDNKDDFNLNVMMFTLYLANNDKESALDILNSLSENDNEKSAYELAVISKMYITVKENDKGLELLKEAWNKDKNDVKVYDVISEITKSQVNNLLDEIEKRSQIDNNDQMFYKVCLLKHYSQDVNNSSKYKKIKEELDSDEIGSYMVELIKQDFFDKENTDTTNIIVDDLIKEDSDSYSVNNIIATFYENKKDSKNAYNYTVKSVNNNKFYDRNYSENIPSELKAKSEGFRIEPYYRQAIYSEPYNEDSILELADFYKNKMSNNDKAYSFYELASKVDTNNAEIIYNMALIKTDKKEVDEALKLLDKCKEMEPGEAKYYRATAKIYYDNGKEDKVIEELRKAYKINNDDVKTLNNAGCYYITCGDDFYRGYYNLKCAYEMLKGSEETETKSIIINNYELAKDMQKNNLQNTKSNSIKLQFKMFD